MTVASGFLDFTFWGLRQSIVYGGVGHVQLLPVSLEARARLHPELIARVTALLRHMPAVEYLAPRLEFQGLVSAGSQTLTFSGIGVEPVTESRVRSLMMLTSGQWFTGGERLPQALVGSGLATRLRVRPRDLVSLIAYSDRGSLTATDVQVAGVFESGVIEYDARTLLVPMATAQDLMESSGISSLAVTLHEATATAELVRRLTDWLAVHRETVRVLPWDQLSPVYASVVHLYRWILDVFLLIVTAVVVLGIANTMWMAVMERVAEVGVLRALGFGTVRIVSMFMLEAGTIGAIGSGIGVVLGAAACLAISSFGIEMPPPPGHSQGYVAEIHIVPRAFAIAVTVAMGSALLAAMGPALRAARQEVSHALRAA